ncbi:MAG: porin family protein [Flavobacteriaceae bacterium]
MLITSITFAQGIDVGIKAGANFANLTDSDNGSTRTGFVAGAFVTLKFSDKIALQGDVLYSQQGAEFDIGKFNLDYVNVPVVFKYYLVKRLNIQAGPQFGVLIDDNDIFDYESYDVSGVVGLGLDLPLGIRVTGRYNFGLSEIFPNINGSSVKNSVFSLTAGFSFL